MKNASKVDILFVMQELIDNCEGAIMAAKPGDYLHNFSFTLQEKLHALRYDIETTIMTTEDIMAGVL